MEADLRKTTTEYVPVAQLGTFASAACGGRSEQKGVAAVEILRAYSEQKISGTATGQKVQQCLRTTEYVPVAQLDRASDSDSEGRWFDSSRAYQKEGNSM